MPENEAERRVREFLEAQHFRVRRIDALPEEQRADFHVTHGSEVYIVEVKGMAGDEQYTRDLAERGDTIREDRIGRTNPVSKRIRESAEQLRSTPADTTVFRIISLVAIGDDPDVQADQFISTIYGIIDLIIPGDGGSARALPCFYFTFNEFFKMPDVDALLVLKPSASRICLNSFCTRARTFRQSKLWQLHVHHGAFCDPVEMEARGEAFIADCDLDRHHESLVRDYIRTKYRMDNLPPHLPIVSHPAKYTAAKIADWAERRP